MKIFLKRLVAIIYALSSILILCLAVVFPFSLGYKPLPPLWTWIVIYSLAIIIMASQQQVMKWCDSVMDDK